MKAKEQKIGITAESFMKFFEDNFNVQFIDIETKKPILKNKSKEQNHEKSNGSIKKSRQLGK